MKPNTDEAEVYNKLTRSALVAKKVEIEPTIWILGGRCLETLTGDECTALTAYLGCIPVAKKVIKFQRIMIRDQVYHSKSYSKASKSSTYTVVYKNPMGEMQYGHINGFLQYDDQGELCNMATISSLDVEAKIGHIMKVKESGNLLVIAVNQIEDVCVYLYVAGLGQTGSDGCNACQYVLRFPNKTEKD